MICLQLGVNPAGPIGGCAVWPSIGPIPQLTHAVTRERPTTEIAKITEARVDSMLNSIKLIAQRDPEVEPPTETTIAYASGWVIRVVLACLNGSDFTLRQPFISGNFEGQVVLEWFSGARRITLRFGEDSFEACMISLDGNTVFIEDFNLATQSEILDAWRWLYANERHSRVRLTA